MWQLPELTIEEIIIYLRKSRADDPLLAVEEVLAKHEQMLDEWVERNLPGLGKVPEANRYREVVSGETIDSRPAVREVLSRIESPSIKAILIVEPQRLSRGDLEDIGRMVKLLRYSNTIVITLQYTYDLRDERDRDLFERELKRGNEFLEYQKRIMGNGRLLSVQNGNFIGQHAPYGYKKIEIKDGKTKCHTLEIIPEDAAVVRMIYDLKLQGYGIGRIVDRLYELGIPTQTGRKRWGRTTIHSMLQNEHYLGKVVWFRKKTIKAVKDGAVVEHRPRAEDYLVYPGKHEAIIDEETFQKVRATFKQNPPNKKSTNLVNPLAGLMYCECGYVMKRHAHVVRGVEKAAPRYQCANYKDCNTASSRVSEVIQKVKEALQEALEDCELRVDSERDESLELHLQMVARLEKRQAELEALEVAQWEKYTLDGMPKHIFEQLNKKVLEEKAEVQEALCTARGSIPEPIDFEAKATTLRAVLDMMDDPDAPIRELNALLKQCIERITYSRPKAHADGTNSRWTTGNPVQLDIQLRV